MRIVVKVGTHAIATKTGRPDYPALRRLVSGICALRKAGLEVVFVSSGAVAAGIEALAERTMLAPDNEPTYAVKRGDGRIDEAKDTKYSGPTVEIWRYDPLIFSEDGRRVDSLSLWLSLRDETDPRVRKEMDSMMEALKW